MKTYWIRKSPKGKLYGNPKEFKYMIDDPDTGRFYSYDAYKRKLKELGRTVVRVKLLEVKK